MAQLKISYYHGTSALGAVCIAVDGFRLLHASLRQWGDGALGGGLYVTASLETAAFFATVADGRSRADTRPSIVRVRMSPGTRILRLDGRYSRRSIDYLRREFGKGVLAPRFDRAIPANKQLTRTELINLANYLWERGGDGKRAGIAAWSGREDQGPLRRVVMRYQYDGMGCPATDIGIVVFNPSRLMADGVFQLAGSAGVGVSPGESPSLESADPKMLATGAADSIRSAMKTVQRLKEEIAREEGKGGEKEDQSTRNALRALLEEIPRWRNCLREFQCSMMRGKAC